jgi:WD40 repeat protein/serine/threonine protein kinase
MNPTDSAEGGSVEALVSEVTDEFMERLERGERPEVEAYAGRYPQIAGVLRHVLPALQVLQAPTRDAVSPAAGAAAAAQTLGCLGDYHIVGELGRGGMGVVYEAVQISLARRVALKVLPFAAALDAKQLQRFKNEAQAAAHLHHTNIVPVYGVGCERGVHYYAMQLIEGQTLANIIRGLRQLAGAEPEAPADAAARLLASDLASGLLAPPRRDTSDEQPTGSYVPPVPDGVAPASETARTAALSAETSVRNREFFRGVVTLGVQAAGALEYAHQMGVVHRDIKPANLLVDARGNVWVTDFGLAHCQSQAGLTMTGDLVGTLRYMSPEQALAQRVVVDQRTDVYSLGATLYELLTLEPAFTGRDRQELLRQIAFEEPRPPRRLNPAIPTELETIVLKALAKNPDDRYGTAQELADDLNRFAEDKPIRARRVSLGKRVLLWIRRRPADAALVAVSALAALTAVCLIVFLVLNGRLQAALGQTIEAKESAEGQRREALKFRYYNHIALAGVAWRDANMGRLEQLLDECPPDYQHHWEWRFLKRQCHGDTRTLRGHEGGVFCLAYSPDGTRLATGGLDGIVRLWDTATGKVLADLRGHKGEVYAVAFHPDGRQIASCGEDRTARIWDLATRQPRFVLAGHQRDLYGLAFSRDGKRLATGSWDKRLKLWNAATGQELPVEFRGHDKEVWGIAFRPDGKHLASGGADNLVRVWDAATGREALPPLRGHTDQVHGVAFSPDGLVLASASVDKSIRLWDARTGEARGVLGGHTAEYALVAFSPDGKQLAATSNRSVVEVWDIATGRCVRSLKGHANILFQVAFSPDGARLASASQDQTVKFWDADSGQEVRTLAGHEGEVAGVALSPDCRRLASAGADGVVKLWDVATGQELFNWREHQGPVAGVAFSPDGRWLASAGADKTVRIREAATGQVLRTYTGHAGEVRTVAFSPDGLRVATADDQGMVKLWEPATGRELYSGKEFDGEIRSVAFSADGTRLAAAGADRMVKLLDLTVLRCLPNNLTGHHCWVHGLAFSPDDRLLAAGGRDETPAPKRRARFASVSGDGAVKLWDAATGRLLLSIAAHSGYVRGVAFSRDGTRLASASTDGTVKLWDTREGQEVLSLKAPAGGVVSLAFSQDGNFLIAGTTDGSVLIWDARPWRDRP